MLTDEQAPSGKNEQALLFERKQWTQLNRMEERKCPRKNKLLVEGKNTGVSVQEKKIYLEMIEKTQIQAFDEEMLTDEKTSSWIKATNAIQQNARKEMRTDEQTSSWKKATNSIQQKPSSWKKALNWIQKENARGRSSFWLEESHGRTSF